MNSMKTTLLFVLLCCLGFSVNAQRNCGSMEYLEFQYLKDPKRALKEEAIERHTNEVLSRQASRAVTGVVTIPVVVHVVYNTTAENVSAAQIQSQIDVLNADFRRLNADASNTPSMFQGVASDPQIQFCLASVDPSGNPTSGITRTSTTRTSFGTNDQVKFNSSGGKDAWPAANYLNLWVCDISGGILGYAQFPGGSASTDGVVIDYQYFGTIGTATAPFHLGRTATHEVGHWLNLRHIWGDGGCTVDDFVSDTPVAGSANYTGNPCAFPGPNTCNTGAGDQPDMFQNYMDYSDDECMNLFTTGQTARMRALFEPGGARASLLTSPACGTATPPTCTDGIQNGDETGVDCGGSSCQPCPCSASPLTLTITFDNYPEETSWTVKNSSNTTVASGGTYGSQPDGSTINIPITLGTAGNYTFTINDSYGDGICCSYGSGSYTLKDANNSVIATGGQFGTSQSTAFCVGGGGGGPTCTDGIQNGDETGVDCGGANCPVCPTCNDGIQNGDETGVDCGGSCAPCGGGGCNYVTLNSQNFESGWGIWADGGTDCQRSSADAAYANSGTYCVRLRDNTNSSVMTTSNQNLSSYDELTVQFSYITVSFDNSNEDFWLQISTNGGSSYTTVGDFNYNVQFTNNNRGTATVVIPGPFTTNTRLRIRCDASADDDRLYIDDVVITGCLNGARTAGPGQARGEELSEFVKNINLFPNPAFDQMTVTYTMEQAAQVRLTVTDLSGKTISRQEFMADMGDQRTQLDVSNLPQGIYLMHLATAEGSVVRKFVVGR